MPTFKGKTIKQKPERRKRKLEQELLEGSKSRFGLLPIPIHRKSNTDHSIAVTVPNIPSLPKTRSISTVEMNGVPFRQIPLRCSAAFSCSRKAFLIKFSLVWEIQNFRAGSLRLKT